MNTRFLIPAAVAISSHVFVLFGIRWPHASVSVIADPPRVIDLVPTAFIEDPPEANDTPTGEVTRGTPTDCPPSLPDVYAAEEALFTQPTVAQPSRPTAVPIDVIPGPIGDPASSGGPGIPGAEIVDSRYLDREPRTRVQVPPSYPSAARADGRDGEVLVEFTVLEDGRVRDPRVIRSSDRIFEEPSLRAVERWRFEPGKRGGKPVRFRMRVPVAFRLGG